MRIRVWVRGFVLVPALCLAGLPAMPQQQGTSQQNTGDPVADAARKARESKKDAPKPKKVYTDDDVKTSAPEPPAAPASAATTAQATGDATKAGDAAKVGDATKIGEAAKDGDAPKEDPNGEAAWRKRFQVQHAKIAKTEKELDILSRELEKAQTEYYPDPQKAMKEQNSRADINSKLAKIDAKKKELDQLRHGLDDLEDQLRKAGGNPGWAR